jgi:hypothetical protein
VWVYTANRELSVSEQDAITAKLEPFISGWAAHGHGLLGKSIIIKNRFVILAVDESNATASGCSIDTSVRFIKELGQELNIDFFDRLKLYIEKDNRFNRVALSELHQYGDWDVYNPMISTLKELRENWKIPVNSSPFVSIS